MEIQKECRLCGDSFSSRSGSDRIYCHAEKIVSCDFCEKTFSIICDGMRKQKVSNFCSSSCKAKLAVRKTARETKCKLCEQSFVAYGTKLFCGERKLRACTSCGSSFESVCNSKTPSSCPTCRTKYKRNCRCCGKEAIFPKGAYYCGKEFFKKCELCNSPFSIVCATKANRNYCSNSCAKRSKSKRKICARCGDSFSGTPARLFCEKLASFSCVVCETVFLGVCGKDVLKTCGPLCATLTNSHISPEKVQELKDLSVWVQNFFKEHRRKPKVQDVYGYFGAKINQKYLSQYISVKTRTGSWLEHIVIDYLSERYPQLEVLERKRPLRDSNGGRLEIDLWIPELQLGFEVQDEMTHSKTLNEELSRYKILKRGPAYHELKRRLAKEQLSVDLIDLWEDEIASGEYKQIVDLVLGPI